MTIAQSSSRSFTPVFRQMDRPALAAAASPAQRIEELGCMVLAYSEVTEKLQQAHASLQETVSSLRDELGEKNRLLERRNRLAAIGEMAAGMAHEIRNPLGAIRLYVSMLGKDLADSPANLQVVAKIAAGIQRLDWLVSQTLQFSREITIHCAATDVAALVDNAIALAAPRLQSGKLRLAVEGPRPLVVNVDGSLMVQAILNLVINAAEAMPDGGELLVRLAGGQSHACFRQFSLLVRDTGPGIDPCVLDRIFNPFFTTKDNGTGLGLAIVHRIIDAHDGTIVAGNHQDGGAQFEIRI